MNELTEAANPIMKHLAALFESYPQFATYYTTVVRYVFVALTLFILIKSIRSLLASQNPSEIWAYLALPDGSHQPLRHWENVIGRATSADIVIDIMTVSRNHGTLVRDEDGNWKYNDLGSKGGTLINGLSVYQSTPVEMGDTITMGGVECTLVPASLKEKITNREMRRRQTKPFSPWVSLIALTIFQILTCIQFIAARGSSLPMLVLVCFALFTVVMWAYCIVMRSMHRTAFEMEMIAFYLCTINLSIVASSAPESIFKQFMAIILGMGLFVVLCWYLRDLSRALRIRRLLVLLSIGLLLINIVFGQATNGSVNWVHLGGMNLQPSELVKIAFIFIGSATLDELYEKKNLSMFMLFSIFCLGSLAVMNDFGTALIFFATFLVMSFLRRGEFGKLVLVLGVCGLGGLMAIRFVPHISSRFASWGHIWDYPDDQGFQQTRALSGGSSGGLLGLGAGDGWVHNITAVDTDLVFCMVQEEWGLITAILIVVSLLTLCLFAVRSIRAGRSAYYTIAACSATSLIIVQTMLNVLGSVDILPFTGVTLPFTSNGGTSMLASWGLLAFLKAADTRQNASIAVASTDETDVDEFIEELETGQ